MLLDLKGRIVKVKIDKKDFYVKEMTAGQAEEYEASLYIIKGKNIEYNTKDAKSKLILITVCDEHGGLLFKKADLSLIKALPAHVVNKLFDKATEINSLDVDVQEEAKN